MVKQKEKYRYIFPSKLAARMKKVDMRTQMECSLMSLTFIIFGMIFFALQIVLYGEQSWLFKGTLIFNLLCGFVLMGANLVTQYQQYVFHLQTMGIDPDEERAKVKARGNIFKRIRFALMEKKIRKIQEKKERILAEIKMRKAPESRKAPENNEKTTENIEKTPKIVEGRSEYSHSESIKPLAPSQTIQNPKSEKKKGWFAKVKAKRERIAAEKALKIQERRDLEAVMNKEREFLEIERGSEE